MYFSRIFPSLTRFSKESASTLLVNDSVCSRRNWRRKARWSIMKLFERNFVSRVIRVNGIYLTLEHHFFIILVFVSIVILLYICSLIFIIHLNNNPFIRYFSFLNKFSHLWSYEIILETTYLKWLVLVRIVEKTWRGENLGNSQDYFKYIHYLAPRTSEPFTFALFLGGAVLRLVEFLVCVALLVCYFLHRFIIERATEHLACLYTWPTFRWTLWDQSNCVSSVTWIMNFVDFVPLYTSFMLN